MLFKILIIVQFREAIGKNLKANNIQCPTQIFIKNCKQTTKINA